MLFNNFARTQLPPDSRNKTSLERVRRFYLELETLYAPFPPVLPFLRHLLLARANGDCVRSKSMRPLFPGINRTISSLPLLLRFLSLLSLPGADRVCAISRFEGREIKTRGIRSAAVVPLSRLYPLPLSLYLYLSLSLSFVKGTFIPGPWSFSGNLSILNVSLVIYS